MTPPDNSDRPKRPRSTDKPGPEQSPPSVLSSLPSTRPQRLSPRRAASRTSAVDGATATTKPAESAAKARTAKAHTAKAHTAKASTAKARTAKASTAKAHTAKAHTAKASTAKAHTAKASTAKAHNAKARSQTKAKPSLAAGPSRATQRPRPATPRPGQTASPRAPQEPPVPRQGFEAEGEIAPGVSVQPPSGSELATSVVELIGELAQSGLATGGRLLKDTIARLPGL
jgi:hypothetical protein